MAKRPTPKKRRSKRATRTQHSAYLLREVKRLRNRQQSPYGGPARPKREGDKALKGIMRIKA
jgi:ribosomal protein L44E